MAQFAVLDNDGQASEERFDTMDKAIAKAKEMVTEEPDSEVDVIQFVKTVSSTLQVDVQDVT